MRSCADVVEIIHMKGMYIRALLLLYYMYSQFGSRVNPLIIEHDGPNHQTIMALFAGIIVIKASRIKNGIIAKEPATGER